MHAKCLQSSTSETWVLHPIRLILPLSLSVWITPHLHPSVASPTHTPNSACVIAEKAPGCNDSASFTTSCSRFGTGPASKFGAHLERPLPFPIRPELSLSFLPRKMMYSSYSSYSFLECIRIVSNHQIVPSSTVYFSVYFSATAIALDTDHVVVPLQATAEMMKLFFYSSECQLASKRWCMASAIQSQEQEEPNDMWAHMKIHETWWNSALSTFGQHSHIFRGGAQPGFGGGRKWLRPSSIAGAMILSFTFTFKKHVWHILKPNTCAERVSYALYSLPEEKSRGGISHLLLTPLDSARIRHPLSLVA